jgi:hypothetical protein
VEALEEVEATQQDLDAPEEVETAARHQRNSVVINWLLSYAVEAIANNELITGLCCAVLCCVVLCCVYWLVSPKCLGGKCLGGKFLRRVNASAPTVDCKICNIEHTLSMACSM